MPKLICKRVGFYSENDELCFFEWISRIKAIKKYEGVNDEIHLHIPRNKISNANLRDLTALFYRYKIDMEQLKQFLNDSNREWYAHEEAYWHKDIFRTK